MKLRALAAAVLAAAAQAASAQDSTGRNLAASCAVCHGTGGHSASVDIASLAGAPRDFIAGRLRDFRDGRRPATVMHQLAKGYSDAEIDRLAAWFSAQRK